MQRHATPCNAVKTGRVVLFLYTILSRFFKRSTNRLTASCLFVLWSCDHVAPELIQRLRTTGQLPSLPLFPPPLHCTLLRCIVLSLFMCLRKYLVCDWTPQPLYPHADIVHPFGSGIKLPLKSQTVQSLTALRQFSISHRVKDSNCAFTIIVYNYNYS